MTAVVAVSFQPLRARVQRFVNRLMYGERVDPYSAIAGLGANGEAIFGPGVADRVRRFLAAPTVPDPSQAFPQLTDRELEILQFLAERLTNAEIAAKLFLSQKTVRNYVSAIFAKLQVADRAEAGLVARAAGLGERQLTKE